MEYQEFLNKLHRNGSKPHNISHCLGAREAWKWVRKNRWKSLKGQKCSSSTYGAVIDKVNKLIVESMFEGHEIVLPYQMGAFKLAATPAKVDIKDGCIKSNYRIDWKKTLEYWYNDAEAKRQRKHVKRIQKYIYSILYSKEKAAYRNQRYYQFRPNRSLVRTLGRKIDNQKLNALIY